MNASRNSRLLSHFRCISDRRNGKTKLAEKQLLDKSKEKETVEMQGMQTHDYTELGKLEKRHANSKPEFLNNVQGLHKVKNSISSSFSKGVHRDDKNTPLLKARGVKSREVYKRRKSQKQENKEDPYSHELEASLNKEFPKLNEKELLPFTENDVVSKSLVKIKALVNRRKTEELLLLRSRTAKLPARRQSYSPTQNSRSFEEMCKAEIQLRETISREQQKLLALKERRRQQVLNNRNGMGSCEKNDTNSKERKSIEAKKNSRKNPRTKNVNKFETRSNTELACSNPKQTQHNAQHEKMEKCNTHEREENQLQQIHKTHEAEYKNQNSSVNAMIELVTCSNCGRGFMRERIAKHEKACRKASARMKKPFDAKRKRAEGTDMEKYIIVGKDLSDDSAYKVKHALKIIHNAFFHRKPSEIQKEHNLNNNYHEIHNILPKYNHDSITIRIKTIKNFSLDLDFMHDQADYILVYAFVCSKSTKNVYRQYIKWRVEVSLGA